MSAKEKKSAASEENVIATNRKARFEYEILEKFEAGISLVGSEVKSLRNRDVSIAEAFARPKVDEVCLLGMNIKPYAQANIANHEPLRPRKLLLHRREIDKIIGKVAERGFTLIPLLLYWKHGIAKVLIAVARGKRQFDKRQTIKKREADREIRRERGRRR
jgi:SsrA-binding protein